LKSDDPKVTRPLWFAMTLPSRFVFLFHSQKEDNVRYHLGMKAILCLVLPLFAIAFLSGCASNSAPLKAKPAAPSAFLENPGAMKSIPDRVPFRTVWETQDLDLIAANYRGIYVAPVNTQYLRPVNRPLVKLVEGPFATRRPVAETANLLQTNFANSFKTSPQPKLQVAAGPGRSVLTLELALIELNPTNVVGNAVRYGAPGGSALAPLTKGNIAIEGKVRDSQSKKLLFQFADNEQDAFHVVSLRDLSSYGHSRATIHEWAREFEELTRTLPNHKVAAPSGVGLNPF